MSPLTFHADLPWTGIILDPVTHWTIYLYQTPTPNIFNGRQDGPLGSFVYATFTFNADYSTADMSLDYRNTAGIGTLWANLFATDFRKPTWGASNHAHPVPGADPPPFHLLVLLR